MRMVRPRMSLTSSEACDRLSLSSVQLLGALAIGYDESHLPAGVDIQAWRRKVTEMCTADPSEVLREFDEWVRRATDDGERRVREMRRAVFDFDAQCASMGWEIDAYDAVRAGVPTLCALVGDSDPMVRAAAIWTLGWFPEESARIVPRLLDVLEEESVPGVLANAIVAVGLLGDAAQIDRLRAFLVAEAPLSRWGAATAMARLGVADPKVIRELADCCASPPEQGEPGVAFYEGDLRGYASNSLALLGVEVVAEALTSLLEGLSRTSGHGAVAVAAAVLRMTFGAERLPSRPPYEDLTELQRCTIEVLAELDEETWHWASFIEILRSWNLPDRREACRGYAGLPNRSAPDSP